MKNRIRASAVVLHQDKLLGFRAIDPYSEKEYFFLPGGRIEDNETAPNCAVRETLEETGYKIQIDPQLCIDAEYEFYWNGEDFLCTTLFYFGVLQSPFAEAINTQGQEYNKGVQWVSLSDIDAVLGYSSAILGATKEVIAIAQRDESKN
ncbi:MAG TPA: NUDIX hydrolase [Pseudobdellovibrionaceae bacterium]|jgi:8-oxo-dGTP pyrophosphatase MutT (NUDIX family)|nr:NUDIX hydrolase [Pseudobdellovibrionaceae bacterium]